MLELESNLLAETVVLFSLYTYILISSFQKYQELLRGTLKKTNSIFKDIVQKGGKCHPHFYFV